MTANADHSQGFVPIFLVGAERSGTTVLRLMLDHHPQIAFHSEFELAVDRVSDAGDLPALEDYLGWLKTNRAFHSSKFAIDASLTYRELVDSFLAQKRERDGKRLVGACVHRHFDRLLHLWPDARFIHLLRDGRDVARSCIGMGWSGNLWTACERWIHAEVVWERMRTRVPPEHRIEARYEALMADAAGSLARICEFIGVPYDGRMLEYPSDSTYDAPDPALVYQWKKKLSEGELRLVEARIGEMLVERGYELSGLEPMRVTSALERRLRLQDKLARTRVRIRRYGLPLVGADFLSRRLGLAKLQRPIQQRMNAIDQSLTR